MKALVLLTDGFGGVGGIAKFNRDFLTALSRYPGCGRITALPRLMQDRSAVPPTNVRYVTEGINNKLRYAATALKFGILRGPFDVIFCGHINLLPAACLARASASARLILIMHGTEAWQPPRGFFRPLLRRVRAFISVSELTKKRFLSWSGLDGAEGFVLPNAVDLSAYGPGGKNPALIERYGLRGKTVLMTLGRLEARERLKGFDEVLSVLPSLAERIPNVAYVIGGDGSDRERLTQKARRLGIADRVIFTGFVLESEKLEHYRLADAFVMPGRGEGFGIVYLEAMACGVPVLGSKLDASREALMEGKLGVLVDPSNPEELVDGILEALRRPKGVVPRDLSYFSYDAFEKRAHAIFDRIGLYERI